mgnify:CR=1 FL=1
MQTELEFINEVADDCISKLTEKNKEYLIDNPYAIDYHFSYCLYITNVIQEDVPVDIGEDDVE